jgi:hypothetical protein
LRKRVLNSGTMKEARLTLSQLAHFDRCIFPGDFADSLVALGVERFDADMVARWLMDRENKPGVVKLWQVFARKNDKMAEAFNKLLTEWNERFPDNRT